MPSVDSIRVKILKVFTVVILETIVIGIIHWFSALSYPGGILFPLRFLIMAISVSLISLSVMFLIKDSIKGKIAYGVIAGFLSIIPIILTISAPSLYVIFLLQ